MNDFHCVFHPTQENVGVCSSCLRERLLILKSKSADSDFFSSGCLSRRRTDFGDYYYFKADGIRSRDLVGEEKKGRKIVRFTRLRSLLGFMRKDSGKTKASKVEHGNDRSRGVKVQDCFEEERNSWILSVVAMSGSEPRSTAETSSLRRSTSRLEKEFLLFNRESTRCAGGDREQNSDKELCYSSADSRRHWAMSKGSEFKCSNPRY